MKTMLYLSEFPSGSSVEWPCPAWAGRQIRGIALPLRRRTRPKRFPRFTDSAGLNLNPVVGNFPCILDFHLICPYNAFSDGQ